MSSTDYGIVGFVIGAIGDITLQWIVGNGWAEWGLRSYFQKHGPVESVFIAAGMLSFFSYVYPEYIGIPTFQGLALYGALLDITFRVYNIMPSLADYYEVQNEVKTIMWAIIPLAIVHFIII